MLGRMLRCSLIVTLALAACAGSPAADDAAEETPMRASLAGKSWTLEAFGEEPVLASTTVTLSFEDERVTGSAGVNRYFGNWSIADGALQIEPLGSTRMAGPPDAQQQEDRFLAELGACDAYRIEGEALWLLAEGRRILRFARR
jgi:heat shock protein HslJ